MDQVQEILAQLTSLKHKDLVKIRKACEALEAQTASGSTSRQEPELLYNALRDVLKTHSIRLPSYISHFKGKPEYREFCRVAEEIDEYTKENFGKVTNRERRKLYITYVNLIVASLQGAGAPVGFKTVAQHLHKFSSLMDRAFPLYASNGLLRPLILDGVIHEETSE